MEIATAPNDAQSFILRGLALWGFGDYRHAINDMDHAIALTPENPQVHAARGHVYLEMGELERARADFLSSQDRGFQDDTVSFLLEWLTLCQERPDAEHAARLEGILEQSHPASTRIMLLP